LELAVLKTVTDAIRINRPELVAFVGRLFGWDRNGALIARAIDRAVTTLLKRGEVVADSDAILLA